MSVPVAFVVVAAVGYFASSVFRTLADSNAAPAEMYSKIVGGLEELSRSGRYVSRRGSKYLIWPKGPIDGISYPGVFATYINPMPSTHSFQVVTYAYVKGTNSAPSWKLMENFTTTSVNFKTSMRSVVGLPPSGRAKLLGTFGAASITPPSAPVA